MAASDFLTTEVWTLGGLVTYYIFFVIELSSRKVQIAGMTPNPDGLFMTQIARNLTNCQDGFLKGKKVLLRDRDKKYTEQFDSILCGAGKNLSQGSPGWNAQLLLPPRSVVMIAGLLFGWHGLKVKLPPSYRAFLSQSNGWKSASREVPVLRQATRYAGMRIVP